MKNFSFSKKRKEKRIESHNWLLRFSLLQLMFYQLGKSSKYLPTSYKTLSKQRPTSQKLLYLAVGVWFVLYLETFPVWDKEILFKNHLCLGICYGQRLHCTKTEMCWSKNEFSVSSQLSFLKVGKEITWFLVIYTVSSTPFSGTIN